jgi:8-oxo-dGTP pyrophosphatase MutT (NUDIX family)
MSRIVRIFWKFLRPFAHFYWRLTRSLTVGVRGLVRDEAGRVLLVRHSYAAGWYFPGGGVERGETTLTALTRELDEEAGVILTGTPRFVGLYANFREFKSDHVAFYVIEAGQYELVERSSFEIAEYRFFALDALPDETTRATRARLVELEQDAPSPELW